MAMRSQSHQNDILLLLSPKLDVLYTEIITACVLPLYIHTYRYVDGLKDKNKR